MADRIEEIEREERTGAAPAPSIAEEETERDGEPVETQEIGVDAISQRGESGIEIHEDALREHITDTTHTPKRNGCRKQQRFP